MLGIMAGGMILRRLHLSVKASAILCSGAVLLAIIFALPLLFLGCPTQNIAGIYPANSERQDFISFLSHFNQDQWFNIKLKYAS